MKINIGDVVLAPLDVSKDQTVRFEVVVLDERINFGRDEVKIAPVKGADDTAWITRDRIRSAYE